MASEAAILGMYSIVPDRMWRNPVCTTVQSSIRLAMVPHHILCSCFDTYALRLFIKLKLKFLIVSAFPANKNSMECAWSAHSSDSDIATSLERRW